MRFTASQFTATKFSSPMEKAKFANQLVKFVKGGFSKNDFPKWFYERLSMTFGHIAHYNQGGFYEEWFSTLQDQKRWIENVLGCSCYGQPNYTFCDVEKVIQKWLKDAYVA